MAGKYDWNSDLPAEVSLEERFAERMGIKLGDLLTFNVHEVLIIAKVINDSKDHPDVDTIYQRANKKNSKISPNSRPLVVH